MEHPPNAGRLEGGAMVPRSTRTPEGAQPRRGVRPPVGEPVLDRAFRILACFGPTDHSLPLTALAARAGLPKASASRLATKLVALGALERTATGEYVIGLRMLELAALAPRGHGLRASALSYLEDLHQATGGHVELAVRDDLEALLVEQLSARGAGRTLYRVGGRMPLYGTGVGLALLAYAPTAVQDRVLSGDLTLPPENTVLSPSDVRTRLARVRREGVITLTRPQPEPMTSVAVPILDRDMVAVAAISVVTRAVEADPPALVPAVIGMARLIARAIAARPEQRAAGNF
jgi:DNA-binding IclR family transcriptional regulator